MRWISCLLWSLLAASAFAQTGVQATRITVTSSGSQPADVQASLFYPARTVFRVELAGLVPGRSYSAHALVLDARPNKLAERSWTLAPTETVASVSIDFTSSVRHEPGQWIFALLIDGKPVAERSMQASRRPAAPAPPPLPLSLVRATVTTSLTQSTEPRRPLKTLKLPSAVFYYVEAKGFVPGRSYQVRVVVLDGAKNLVGNHQFATTPRHAQHVVWFPIIPRETHAPGQWTFRMYLGESAPASHLVAETSIEASPQGGQPQAPGLEPYASIVGVALACLLAYLAYNLFVYARAPAGAAPVPVPGGSGARGLLDPSLYALIAANLLPLGVVVLGSANAADLLLLYWVENLVVAVYAILRIATARGAGGHRLGSIFFFVLHFGVCCAVHGGFLLSFLGDDTNWFAVDVHGMLNPGTAAQFDRFREPWDVVPFALVLQASLLVISHGISFVHHYLKGGEYLLAKPGDEMMRPYRRVMVMQVAIVATGFVASLHGSPLTMLVILVLLKTGTDAVLHVRSHLRARDA